MHRYVSPPQPSRSSLSIKQMFQCGVCNENAPELYAKKQPLFCALCVNSRVQRHRTVCLEQVLEAETARTKVQKVLSRSLSSQSRENVLFLEEYLRSRREKGELVVTEGVKTDSVAALSAQLLALRCGVVKSDMNQILALQKKLEHEVTQKRAEVAARREELQQRQQRYHQAQRQVAEAFQQRKHALVTVGQKRSETAQKTAIALNNTRAILFQQLCRLMMVKKVRLKPSNKFGLSIAQQPVLALQEIPHYTHELVSGSLETLCQFVVYACYYLQVDVPFRVEPPCAANGFAFHVAGLHESSSGMPQPQSHAEEPASGGEARRPSVTKIMLSLNKYTYAELFNAKNRVKLDVKLTELTPLEAFEFSVMVSKLIADLYVLCVSLEVAVGTGDRVTYLDLFQMDEMVYRLVTAGNELNARAQREAKPNFFNKLFFGRAEVPESEEKSQLDFESYIEIGDRSEHKFDNSAEIGRLVFNELVSRVFRMLW